MAIGLLFRIGHLALSNVEEEPKHNKDNVIHLLNQRVDLVLVNLLSLDPVIPHPVLPTAVPDPMFKKNPIYP